MGSSRSMSRVWILCVFYAVDCVCNPALCLDEIRTVYSEGLTWIYGSDMAFLRE